MYLAEVVPKLHAMYCELKDLKALKIMIREMCWHLCYCLNYCLLLVVLAVQIQKEKKKS